MATFILESCQPSFSGITAQARMAITKETTGARKNTNLSDPAGTTISLNTNLSISAPDCKSPNAPTTFGPLRN